jgi:hypothetical protein
MPLKEGKSNSIVAENIKTLMEEGTPITQAIAIALDIQKRAIKDGKKDKEK